MKHYAQKPDGVSGEPFRINMNYGTHRKLSTLAERTGLTRTKCVANLVTAAFELRDIAEKESPNEVTEAEGDVAACAMSSRKRWAVLNAQVQQVAIARFPQRAIQNEHVWLQMSRAQRDFAIRCYPYTGLLFPHVWATLEKDRRVMIEGGCLACVKPLPEVEVELAKVVVAKHAAQQEAARDGIRNSSSSDAYLGGGDRSNSRW